MHWGKRHLSGSLQRALFPVFAVMFLLSFVYAGLAGEDIESKVDEYIQAHLKLEKFSGSVLIAQRGKVLMSKGCGMANYELDVPNTPQTKFRLGSVTKQFTATAVMQLQEMGLLNVEDTVEKFVPDYPLGDRITIHHILTHTAGIPNYVVFPDYAKTMMIPTSPQALIDKFKNKQLEFTPGEKYAYSNSGYSLLGFIIAKASGLSYEDFLDKKIFQPLNMKNSGYDAHSPILKKRASGYSGVREGFVNAPYIDMSIPYAAGALYSTVEDLYTWDRALYTEKLLKKASLDKMFIPYADDYGYGWTIGRLFNRKCISHLGGVNGFYTSIARFPDDDVCIIVLSNLEFAPVDRIAQGIAAIIFGEAYEFPKKQLEAKVDPRIYNDYAGQYELPPNIEIHITVENDRLFAEATGQPKWELFPESETTFFLKFIDARVVFVRDESGKVTHFIFQAGGGEQTAKKIE